MFISQAYHCYQVLHEEKSSISKTSKQTNADASFTQKLKQVFSVKKRVFQS